MAPTVQVTLDLHEVSVLLMMVSERISASDAEGIPPEHSSSRFRDALLAKLVIAKQALLDAAAAAETTASVGS